MHLKTGRYAGEERRPYHLHLHCNKNLALISIYDPANIVAFFEPCIGVLVTFSK